VSEPVSAPLTAAGHAAKGQGFLAQAETATLSGRPGEAAGLVLLARMHFLAARTLNDLAVMEMQRGMRLDTKGMMAAMADRLGLGGEGGPALLAQAAPVGWPHRGHGSLQAFHTLRHALHQRPRLVPKEYWVAPISPVPAYRDFDSAR
jgi:hypothetical protein